MTPRPPGWLAHQTTRRPCLLPGARWWYRRGDWRHQCRLADTRRGDKP